MVTNGQTKGVHTTSFFFCVPFTFPFFPAQLLLLVQISSPKTLIFFHQSNPSMLFLLLHSFRCLKFTLHFLTFLVKIKRTSSQNTIIVLEILTNLPFFSFNSTFWPLPDFLVDFESLLLDLIHPDHDSSSPTAFHSLTTCSLSLVSPFLTSIIFCSMRYHIPLRAMKLLS